MVNYEITPEIKYETKRNISKFHRQRTHTFIPQTGANSHRFKKSKGAPITSYTEFGSTPVVVGSRLLIATGRLYGASTDGVVMQLSKPATDVNDRREYHLL